MTNLAAIAAEVEWPDHDASTRAHDCLATGAASAMLGRLAPQLEWVASVQANFPPRELTRARLVIFTSDHGVAAAGVSAYPIGWTTRAVEDIRAGNAVVNAVAESSGASVRVVEAGATVGRIDLEAALTAAAVEAAISLGVQVADEEVDTGADLLIAANLGIASTTSAAAIISIITGTEPVKVVGRGGGQIDDSTWMHKVSAIRDARLRGWTHRADPMELLAAVGGADIAALAAFLLRAAARRTPVLLDGVVTAAAAAVAAIEQPRAARWWRAAQNTGEPGQLIALKRLDLEPMLELEMMAGDGTGGLLALNLLRMALAAAGPIVAAKGPSPAAS